MGLFSCCMNDKRSARYDTETRQARIVQVYQGAADELYTSPRIQAPPPAYNEAVSRDDLSGPTIYLDEKAPQTIERRLPRSASSSPRTSIISVPSTRLTDLTSARTGETSITLVNQQPQSQRSSLVFESAPPSYYDGRSERSTSPHSQIISNTTPSHPVMSEDWLETLRIATQRGFAQSVPGVPAE